MKELLINLDVYRLQKFKKIKSRKEVLKNTNIFFNRREIILHTFEENVFRLPLRPPSFQEKDDEGEENILLKVISEIIGENKKGIYNALFREYFRLQVQMVWMTI